MGGGAPATAFTPAEQGVGNRLTGTNRLTHDPSPADRAAADDAGARAVLERQKAFRADPPGLIQLAEELQQTFLRAGEKAPRTRRAAAIELLRIYGKLKEFESSNTPRGPGGSLQYKAPPGMRLQPWTRKHPRVVADIPPFSTQNVRAWEAAAAAAGPPLPSLAPPRVTSPPPKPKPVVKKPPDRFGIQIIKLPGMTLKSKGGQIQILASILRVLSRQALSGAEAYAVASKLDFSKYWVLDFEDTVEYATKVFEGYSPGNPHTFRLKNDLLQDLTRFTSLPLYPEQRVQRAVNDFSSEYFPDFTNDERLWYVIERIKHSPNRDPNSGHKPGEVVSADGVMFVGPEPSSSLYWTPNGRLYLVPQKSLREQQIDAVIKGFVDARGGVILGYGVIVVGVAAYAAPAVVGAFASALAPLFTTVTGLLESVSYSQFVVWLGMNWEVVTLKAAAIGAGVSLAVKIANFDPAAWYAEFRKDPKKALGDAIYLIAETVHDYFELRQGFGPGTPRLTPAPGTPRGPAIDDQPAPVPTPSRPAGPTRQPTTVTTEPDVAAPPVPGGAKPPPSGDMLGSHDQSFWSNDASTPTNRLASRPQPDLPYTDELAARRSRMTNPSTASAADQPATAVQVQPARVLKKTGTGSVDVIEDDQTAGITTVATAGPRQTTPSKPTRGVVKGSGGGGKATADKRIKGRGTDDRLQGKTVATSVQVAGTKGTRDPGYSAWLQYREELIKRFPLLESHVSKKPIYRARGEPGLWEESVFTGSGRLSWELYLRKARRVEFPRPHIQDRVQIDDIDRDGWLVDTKMVGIGAGREIKPAQVPDVVEEIRGQGPQRSYSLFRERDQQELLGQLQAAKENGLPGVRWETNSLQLKQEVERFAAQFLTDQERPMVSVQLVER
jgi:hypothetical protein